jgi:hypothetical protein
MNGNPWNPLTGATLRLGGRYRFQIPSHYPVTSPAATLHYDDGSLVKALIATLASSTMIETEIVLEPTRPLGHYTMRVTYIYNGTKYYEDISIRVVDGSGSGGGGGGGCATTGAGFMALGLAAMAWALSKKR